MKRTSWIAVLVIAASAACTFAACTDIQRECHPRGEGPGSGAGGAIITPGGPGGFGDVPPPGPQDVGDPPECNESDETELNQVSCGKPAWGGPCMELCAQNGALCLGGMHHTVTKKLLLLYKCCGCKGGECWYVDPDDIGKVCVYSPETGPKWAKCK